MIRNKVNLAINISDRLGAKTMGQPHDDRRAATQAFIESLAQLEQTFEPAESEPAEPADSLPPPNPQSSLNASEQSCQDSASFSLSSFEDAIADLEQFIQSNQSQETL